ncbi:choline sulfate utilization transcriptional regulator [Phytopseudomonas dryadis]|uniref:LysR family transcriptional regulator n=1 Tax=Phytopseudomonas dryadis TaxID=2487520 RepID=A0A4Q9R0T3_9GAMM|nr:MULTISPECIES: LysR family transcriptional regulator [Pseudomonas]TBU90311.1 LysR family transcriptional regulator [Pseudomonas dryadis]TBV04443.1 LysR family transcriptional regulator [Pseudomonas dryadis]TBV17169.1 LysR family transcriptional regulator [Pseudomonas sp. FRB 230]
MFKAVDGISLDVLRVFESAARQLSFTAAAAELGSSQPAISQQIKRLERQLATRLFDRVYRGIVLTEAGELLLQHVQDGLATLDAGLAAVTARQQHEVLQVATDFAFAAYWLMPRLHRFHQQHPEVDVSLITSERDMGSLPSEIDVAISFGDGRFKNGQAHLLFSEEVFPVCSPQLLKGAAAHPGEVLAHLPLLHLRPESRSKWFDWNGLFRALDIAELPGSGSLRFDNYTLLIQAAIAGQGVAIGWRHLVDELLAQGLLARVDGRTVTSSFGYYVVLPERKRRARLVQRFVEWVGEELQREPAVSPQGITNRQGIAV